jgi:amidase
MNNSICHLTASQLVQGIQDKLFSVTEVIEAHLKQIESVNSTLNAVIQTNVEDAVQQARVASQKVVSKQALGPLHGLPFTVKNACHVQGFSPDKGCAGLVGRPSEVDATVVARLKQAGAIVLGLTNTPELTLGYETDNLVYGRTLNPHDLARTPGGSSGGEAAIIAAFGSPLGIASDGGGSIRLPAHYTGIVGMRATQGLIPFTGNIPIDGAGLFSQFISFGPMARTVEDIKLVLPLIAGPDGRDPHTVPVPLRNPDNVDIAALKVVFYTNDGVSKPTDGICHAIEKVAYQLTPLVKEVTEERPAVLENIYDLLTESIFLGGDEGLWLTDILEYLSVKKPSPLLLEFLALAKRCRFSVTDLRKRWVAFDQYRMEMLAFMSSYDVLLCPVAATPAKLHGTSYQEIKDVSYVMAHTLTGWPALVVPIGTSEEGLPIGIQILANPWRDDVVLAVGEVIEKMLRVD